MSKESIVFDAIFIDPVGTREREGRGGGAVEWTDRTSAVSWRLIDDEVEGAGAGLRAESEDDLESPVSEVGMLEKELIGGSEVGGVSTCRERRVQGRLWRVTDRRTSDRRSE